METPVEPLDDVIDAETRAEVLAEVGVVKESESPATTEEYHHDDEAEDPDELPSALRGASASVRPIDPRLDTQRHLSVPQNDLGVGETTALDVNQPVDEVSEQQYYDDPTPREKMVARADNAAAHDEDLVVPRHPEPVVSPRTRQEVADRQLAEVHEFLYAKILDNQCSSHAKEIHEFIGAHLSPVQQAQLLPSVFSRLAGRFQDEAARGGEDEVCVDIQSSLCVLEQMFLSLGRLSPLQDMYTAEEERMLDELVHTHGSNNVAQL